MLVVVLAALLGCSSPAHVPTPAPGSAAPIDAAPVPRELACKVADDCMWSDLARAVTTPDECECRQCMSALVNRETHSRWGAAYREHCKVEQGILNGRKVCPIYDCLWMQYRCQAGRCVQLDERCYGGNCTEDVPRHL